MPDQVKTPVATTPPPKQPDPVIKTPVTATVTQPPGGTGPVTHATKTDPQANVLNQAEAKQQSQAHEGVGGVEVPANYNYSIEQGTHKLTVSAENGLNYNFHAVCHGCFWEGRYLTQAAAESACQQHLAIKFPDRG